MTDEDLIGYLLDLLGPDDRAAVAARLASHPPTAARLAKIAEAIAPLDADREPPEPRPGLADRTLARLDAALAIPGGLSPHPVTPERAETRGSGARLRADLVVALGIGLIAVGLVLSGVSRARHASELAACQNNLRVLHNGLAGYADSHDGRFPQVGVDPYPTAGTFVRALLDAGQFPDGFTPICPAVLAAGEPPAVGYTYTLGHLAPGGAGVLGLRRSSDPTQENDLLPIAADYPSAAVVPGTGPFSPHRGVMCVLSVAGNVRATTVPTIGPNGDDIYRNRNGLVCAGVDRSDVVLGRATDRP